MPAFELRTTSVGSDHSANFATTIALVVQNVAEISII